MIIWLLNEPQFWVILGVLAIIGSLVLTLAFVPEHTLKHPGGRIDRITAKPFEWLSRILER